MGYTDEPFGLRWLNNMNTNALGIAVSQVVWVFGSAMLTLADRELLLATNAAARESGIILAGMLLGAWTGKSIVGAVDAQNKRKLHPDAAPALEAQERGKVTGAAAAVVLAESAADAKAHRELTLTGEHPVPAPGPSPVSVEAQGEVTIRTAPEAPQRPPGALPGSPPPWDTPAAGSAPGGPLAAAGAPVPGPQAPGDGPEPHEWATGAPRGGLG